MALGVNSRGVIMWAIVVRKLTLENLQHGAQRHSAERQQSKCSNHAPSSPHVLARDAVLRKPDKHAMLDCDIDE